MRKIVVIGVSILSVFILCSLSYQPIIAEEPIIETQIEDIPIKSDDCGCGETTDWEFPIICDILGGIMVFCVFLIYVLNLGKILGIITLFLGDLFNCPWVW